MTEPTDAEILELASQYWHCLDETESATEIELVRAALAKWGTPQPTTQPTQAQAGAVPLADYKAYALIDSMGWSLDDQEKDDMLRLLRATEAAHGIKGGQHGTNT